MKKSRKMVYIVVAMLLAASIYALTGCGKTENAGSHTDNEAVKPEHLIQEVDSGAIAANDWTQEKIDEVNQKERAMLEEKVQAAGGIGEKQAIEIAQKAMETDLGDRGKKLKLIIDEIYGWSSDLCVADWSEIKEEDRGKIAYCIGFNNAESVVDWKDLINYVCVVNAVDGSILEAYEIQGSDSTVYYEH